jgi:hypothetical protein
MFAPAWAIARLTLLEAARRKVFAVLAVFAVALVSSALFFPSVEIAGRLRLAESWALRAMSLFAAIVALFLAGFALPSDFEQKRIFLLLSKPVSRPAVFLGRFAGYALLLAVFLLVMGVVTVAFLRAVQVASGPGFPPLLARPLVPAAAFEPVGAHEITGGGATHSVRAEEGQALVWRFDRVAPSDLGSAGRVQVRFLFGAVDDPWRASGRVRFAVVGSAGRRLETALDLNTNEEREFEFPADLADGSAPLAVEARAGDADGILAAQIGWVRIVGRPVLFERAVLRGLGLLLLQSLTVLSITLMASTFLSAPTSILLGILLYLVGSAHGYVRDGARDIDRSLAEIKEDAHGHAKTPQDLAPWVLRTATAVSGGVLAVVPDFDHFDFSAWLLKDRLVSGSDLARAFAQALPLVGSFLLLGLVVMRYKKDFG